jgi:YesN/AraC family two-component response regulator
MDIDMPVMNGYDAVKKSLELFPDLKIIVLS